MPLRFIIEEGKDFAEAEILDEASQDNAPTRIRSD